MCELQSYCEIQLNQPLAIAQSGYTDSSCSSPLPSKLIIVSGLRGALFSGPEVF